jgi:hypothetical protein
VQIDPTERLMSRVEKALQLSQRAADVGHLAGTDRVVSAE